MPLAALYDIHANLPALDAVLDEIRQVQVDQIVVGGDVVPGPLPRETLARLQSLDLPVHYIQGNGEAAVLAQMAGADPGVPPQFRDTIRWVAEQLDPEHQRVLGSWPAAFRLHIPPFGETLFVHATPRNNTEMFTRETPEHALLPVFAGANAPLVICGHTHMQFDRTIGNTRVVNAGSVGLPFADQPGAYWLLLGPDIQLRRTPYDFARAADRVRATSYPQIEPFAARNILQPMSEQEALSQFAKVEIR
jgi:predicted phosphodiesterase